MQYTINNSSSNDSLHININIPIVTLNNTELSGLDVRDIDLLYLIIKSSPNTLTYEQIEELILKKYNIFSEQCDCSLYIRKKKHNIHRVICTQFCVPPIIDTIRSLGYRLNNKWIISKNEEASIVNFIDAIGNIFEYTISLQKKIPLIESIDKENQSTYIHLDTSSFIDEINILKNNYVDIAKSFLSELNLTPFEYKFIKIESILNEAHSYISMERRGTGITFNKWRDLFQDELHKLFKYMIYIISD